jgi:hypothetical protein
MADLSIDTRDRVRRIVAGNLRPVRPLWSPARRALLLLPFALLLAALASLRYGLREDADQLGPILTWGTSALEWLLGLTVIAVALREAVPGSEGGHRRLVRLCVLAGIVLSVTTVLTYAAHPTFVPQSDEWPVWRACAIGPLEYSVPLLIVAVVLVLRSFPTHPLLSGTLSGLGAGLVVDSGWRLTCSFTSLQHVFGAHGLAFIAVTFVGALIGVGVDRYSNSRGRSTRRERK